MQPTASKQSSLRCPLNEIFASKGQVQLLRVLATEPTKPLPASEAAARSGTTESGARRILHRLVQTGLVEKTGDGKTSLFAFRREGILAKEVARLFAAERSEMSMQLGLSHSEGMGCAGEEAAEKGRSSGNGKLNPESPEFSGALVALLEEDLSVLRRARENVKGRLRENRNGNGFDLWEWQKILDTFSLPRLLSFLGSESPRAVRLRECSPFPAVLSEEERTRLAELASAHTEAH
ncbi:MAG: MarR family transcriptional regulator [Gemmatimonadota bacterium]